MFKKEKMFEFDSSIIYPILLIVLQSFSVGFLYSIIQNRSLNPKIEYEFIFNFLNRPWDGLYKCKQIGAEREIQTA